MRTINRKENVWRIRKKIHEVARKHGIGFLAAELGWNEKTFGNAVNEYQDHQKLDATVLYEISAITGDFSILDEFERLLGRVAVNLHDFKAVHNNGDLMSGLASSLSTLGKMGDQISKARSPKSENGTLISTNEFHEIANKAYKHIRNIMSVLNAIEKGEQNE